MIDEGCCAYAVADGLGGMPAGEVASQTAIASIGDKLEKEGCGVLRDMGGVCDHAHEAVCQAGLDYGRRGIATTLTLAHLHDGWVHVAHIGDSFAVLVRAGEGLRLTREHRHPADRKDLFSVAPFSIDYRGALTRALGQKGRYEVDLTHERIRNGDRLVLATDGLTDLVSTGEISGLVAEHQKPEHSCQVLLRTALARGGFDNVSIIVVAIDEL